MIMNYLEKIITQHRERLEALADGIIIGKIPAGATDFNNELKEFLSPAHREFLSLCNGGRFGSIDLWGTDEILDNQYRIENSNAEMYEIGQIFYMPLLMDKTSQMVYFNAEELSGMENISTDFLTFVADYIFGEKYKSKILNHSQEGDEWCHFINIE